jgi:hypothetical protein
MPLVWIGVMALLASCATTKEDFRVKSVDSDERIVVGRVRVFFNGVNRTEDSKVCFTANRCVRLDRDGLVYSSVPDGPVELKYVGINDVSVHHHALNLPKFKTGKPGTVTYFGDLVVRWEAPGGIKLGDLVGIGLFQTLFDSIQDDGEIREITVKDNYPTTVGRFHARHGKSEHLNYSKVWLGSPNRVIASEKK